MIPMMRRRWQACSRAPEEVRGAYLAARLAGMRWCVPWGVGVFLRCLVGRALAVEYAGDWRDAAGPQQFGLAADDAGALNRHLTSVDNSNAFRSIARDTVMVGLHVRPHLLPPVAKLRTEFAEFRPNWI